MIEKTMISAAMERIPNYAIICRSMLLHTIEKLEFDKNKMPPNLMANLINFILIIEEFIFYRLEQIPDLSKKNVSQRSTTYEHPDESQEVFSFQFLDFSFFPFFSFPFFS